MFKNKKIMVIVAHPDDEILGLGGTINKLIKNYNVRCPYTYFRRGYYIKIRIKR